MRKLIFLIEGDQCLRENISELLQLDGYEVRYLTSEESRSVLREQTPGIVIFNELTLEEPANEFIKFLKEKVDGVIVLCSDEENTQLSKADIRIMLPFDLEEILKGVSTLSKEIVNA